MIRPSRDHKLMVLACCFAVAGCEAAPDADSRDDAITSGARSAPSTAPATVRDSAGVVIVEYAGALTDLPMPIDPFTGKAFSYRREGNKAILEASAPPGRAIETDAVRYELTLRPSKEGVR